VLIKEYRSGREFAGRLDHGSDLFLSLMRLVEEKDIKMGIVKVIGACKKAVVAVYDQEKKAYRTVALEKPMEILSCVGNISSFQGKPALHLHIVLGDYDGKAFGGHLMEGTEVFAAEFYIKELVGDPLERKYDEITGLNLWS